MAPTQVEEDMEDKDIEKRRKKATMALVRYLESVEYLESVSVEYLESVE